MELQIVKFVFFSSYSGGAAARCRRGKQEKGDVREQRYPQLLLFKIFNKTYVIHKISNVRNSEQTIRLSAQTSSSYMPKNQLSIASENLNLDQSFSKEDTSSKSSYHQNNNITKLSRNKASTVDNILMLDDNQKKR